jgi:translocation protein SEC63
MSGGFRDSFTKEDTKEDLLGYDDTAFYYFVISVLTCVAIPWTLSVISHVIFHGASEAEKGYPIRNSSGCKYKYCATSEMTEKKDEARRASTSCTRLSVLFWMLKLTLLAGIWASIFGIVVQLGNEKEIAKFDPFHILDVRPEATQAQIKRAYRKLSLTYHPDKNPDDPLAASHFIQITKAYQALTDEIAKRNYEKFGNPDGPQTTKVGIGLPKFLLEKDNALMILVAFFLVLLFVVPMAFICYYQQIKNYTANGVMIETLQFLGYYINESTRVKHGPELLAACAESRIMAIRPTDNADMKKLVGQVFEHKKRLFTPPVICKNQFLVWAHMQRKHDKLTENMRSDLDALLRHSMKVTQAMIELACMREWFKTAEAMIDFRRCLVQAMDIKTPQLLQIPHITEEHLEQWKHFKTPVTTIEEFLALTSGERQGRLMELEPEQRADIDAFCAHLGEVELKAVIAVDDEKEIVVGDVATVTVQMKRKHLAKDEAQGPAHAPFFPEPKYEEWWLFLVEATPAKETRIIHFERILDSECFVEEKLRFQITNPGENTLILHALCDAYAGLDKKVDLSFTALEERESGRPWMTHKEDEDLDLQPTLFQQWMGLVGAEDSEEEFDDDDSGGTRGNRKAKAPPVKPDSPTRSGAGSPAKGSAAQESPEASGSDESDDDDESADGSSDSD